MEYGIAHTFTIVNGILTKTPIGYIIGIENIVTYNNNNTDSKIEQSQLTIPQGLKQL
jgi:hypothetical protein